MDIRYEDYPALQFPNNSIQGEATEFPFHVKLSDAEQFQQHELYIEDFFRNTIDFAKIGNPNSIYYIPDTGKFIVGSNVIYDQRYFTDFFEEEISSEFGKILLKDGRVFMYLVMNSFDTLKYFSVNGSYMGVAVIIGEQIIGFEEAFYTESGLKFEEGAHQESKVSGSFLGFSIHCLEEARISKKLLATPNIPGEVYVIEFT